MSSLRTDRLTYFLFERTKARIELIEDDSMLVFCRLGGDPNSGYQYFLYPVAFAGVCRLRHQ